MWLIFIKMLLQVFMRLFSWRCLPLAPIFPLKEDKIRAPRVSQLSFRLPAVGIDRPVDNSNILSFQTVFSGHCLQDLLLGIKIMLAGILFKVFCATLLHKIYVQIQSNAEGRALKR